MCFSRNITFAKKLQPDHNRDGVIGSQAVAGTRPLCRGKDVIMVFGFEGKGRLKGSPSLGAPVGATEA